VVLLDRQRPIDELADLLLAGLLVQLAENRPVPGLSGLGLRVGYNVFLGLIVFAVAAGLQRARAT